MMREMVPIPWGLMLFLPDIVLPMGHSAIKEERQIFGAPPITLLRTHFTEPSIFIPPTFFDTITTNPTESVSVALKNKAMSEVRKLQPNDVWNHFEDLNAVPRASKKEEQVIQFMVDFGNGLGLNTYRDPIGNVIIKKPAITSSINAASFTSFVIGPA